MDWSGELRREIRERALVWAQHAGVPTYESRGVPSTILFPCQQSGHTHGNLFPSVCESVHSEPGWEPRLAKAHSRKTALPDEHKADAKELDSSNSSDALLMNFFCFPGASSRFGPVIGASPTDAKPVFGYKAQVPLRHGNDGTEVDMLLGNTFIEAKLTERDFKSAPLERLSTYADFEREFSVDALPKADGVVHGYQLIRNVLAAHHHSRNLVVLIDARRPDLLHEWWLVHSAIRDESLRVRCHARFWQELAAEATAAHRAMLAMKYGL